MPKKYMEREEAASKMRVEIQKFYQCDADDVEFLNGLDLGTTWESGQDFSAKYQVGDFEGIVYWSTVGQEAKVAPDH